MPRPIWKGYITFGLVNIPVVLYSAEMKAEIQFHMIDVRDHSRIRYERINETTGKPVAWENIAKGYKYNSEYIVVTDEELKKIAGENSKTINIESFVKTDSIDSIYYEKPYYLVPDKRGEKGYVILREILKNSKKAGIAKIIIHTKEYLAVLSVNANALIVNLLRYNSELRPAADFDIPKMNIKSYKITTKEIEIAKQLVQSMTTKWDPKQYVDEYQIALEKWISEKIKTQEPHTIMKKRAQTTLKRSEMINFVELLKKSLQDKKFASKGKQKHKIAVHAK